MLLQSCSIFWLLFCGIISGPPPVQRNLPACPAWWHTFGFQSLDYSACPLAFISRNPRISRACNHNYQPVQCSSTSSGLYSSAKESTPSEMHLIAAHYISQHRQQHCIGILFPHGHFFCFCDKRSTASYLSLCAKRLWDLMQEHDCAAMCKGGILLFLCLKKNAPCTVADLGLKLRVCHVGIR